MAALEALANALKAPKRPARVAELKQPDLPNAPLSPANVGHVIAHFLPENAIVSDEGATVGMGFNMLAGNAAPHDHLSLTGGSIGQGIPLAGGAAMACPNRKVICLHGDAGAIYTLQALWTLALEKLDVTTVFSPTALTQSSTSNLRASERKTLAPRLCRCSICTTPRWTGCSLHPAWVWKPPAPKRLRFSPANLTAQSNNEARA